MICDPPCPVMDESAINDCAVRELCAEVLKSFRRMLLLLAEGIFDMLSLCICLLILCSLMTGHGAFSYWSFDLLEHGACDLVVR